ncbi:MAG: GspH/FimT family pseudopilin [Burkholderiaceae bacterium]|nr:GspH/FimT family pseudopilin [Burkholderiaceae bacterium]
MRRQAHGFTLLELLLVILLAGILSFYAGGRLSERGPVNARGFADQVAATLRLAQKMAVAQRRTIYVSIEPGARRVRACLDAACSAPVSGPAGGALETSGPAGLTLASSAAAFAFDALGRPSAAATLTVSAGAASFGIVVEADSGYVRRT